MKLFATGRDPFGITPPDHHRLNGFSEQCNSSLFTDAPITQSHLSHATSPQKFLQTAWYSKGPNESCSSSNLTNKPQILPVC